MFGLFIFYIQFFIRNKFEGYKKENLRLDEKKKILRGFFYWIIL